MNEDTQDVILSWQQIELRDRIKEKLHKRVVLKPRTITVVKTPFKEKSIFMEIYERGNSRKDYFS